MDKTINCTSLDQLPLALSVNDVMQVLGISRNTAYALLHSGRLHSVRIGRKLIIPKDALRKYFEAA